MDLVLWQWVDFMVRWTHVIAGIAWIGSSFYFVFLDSSLEPPTDPALKDKGVGGELWAVHGGGFYNPQKYTVAPKTLPEKLHWFFWESYSTWLTGFGLFTTLYLFNAGTFLIDQSVHHWSPLAAIHAAGSLDYSRETANRYARAAETALTGLPDNEWTRALRGLARYAVDRKH